MTKRRDWNFWLMMAIGISTSVGSRLVIRVILGPGYFSVIARSSRNPHYTIAWIYPTFEPNSRVLGFLDVSSFSRMLGRTFIKIVSLLSW